MKPLIGGGSICLLYCQEFFLFNAFYTHEAFLVHKKDRNDDFGRLYCPAPFGGRIYADAHFVADSVCGGADDFVSSLSLLEG